MRFFRYEKNFAGAWIPTLHASNPDNAPRYNGKEAYPTHTKSVPIKDDWLSFNAIIAMNPPPSEPKP